MTGAISATLSSHNAVGVSWKSMYLSAINATWWAVLAFLMTALVSRFQRNRSNLSDAVRLTRAARRVHMAAGVGIILTLGTIIVPIFRDCGPYVYILISILICAALTFGILRGNPSCCFLFFVCVIVNSLWAVSIHGRTLFLIPTMWFAWIFWRGGLAAFDHRRTENVAG